MTAARKLRHQHAVSYMIVGQNFLIRTNNVDVVDILKDTGIKMTFENHSYHVTLEELPQSPLLDFRKYQVKPITDNVRTEFEEQLQKMKDIEAAIQAMNETYELQEELLKKMVKKKGLHLKPHLPEDSEMFSTKHGERVHIKQSLNTIIDQIKAEELIEDYPQLKKCFKMRKSFVFDRAYFKKIQPTLPAAAIKQIVSYNEMESLNFYTLEEWECKHCGGTYTKKGVCKHCGLSKEL